MLKYPIVRGLISWGCERSPTFARKVESVKNTVHKKITSKLPPQVVRTADKICYLFEVQLPFILVLCGGTGLCYLLAIEAKYMAFTAVYIVFDMVAMSDIYPYDYFTDMTEKARLGAYSYIDLNEEMNDLMDFIPYLDKPEDNNVLVWGESGSGKTTKAEALALLISDRRCPKELKDYRVLSLNIEALLAQDVGGMGSSTETRLLSVLQILQMTEKKTIVFVDEMHKLMQAVKGRTSLMDTLKPQLTLGYMRVLGATTREEAAKYIVVDDAADRRFTAWKNPVSNDEKCKKILSLKFKGEKPIDERVKSYAIAQADLFKARQKKKKGRLTQEEIEEAKEMRPGSVCKLVATAFVEKKKRQEKGLEPLTLTKEDIDRAVVFMKKNAVAKEPSDQAQIVEELRSWYPKLMRILSKIQFFTRRFQFIK